MDKKLIGLVAIVVIAVGYVLLKPSQENEQADHFSQCSEQIKKDVVFAASLYL